MTAWGTRSTQLTPSHPKYLPTSPTCFVCGEENPCGLHARFHVEDDLVVLPLRPTEHHCGYPGVVHGGIIAAALDESMGWAAARALHRMCVTGELTVRYLKPLPPIHGLVVRAGVLKAGRRMVHTHARLEDRDGICYARAEGKFLPLSVEETLRVDGGMIYRGGEEKVFESLHGK